MKTVKIFAAWLLLAALLIPSLGLTSCSTPPTGPGEEGSQSAEGSVTSEQTQETETGRESIADNLPDGLTFSGETVCVLTRSGDEDTRREFLVDEGASDLVSSAVHERNTQVEDRLDFEIEIIESNDNRHAGAVINQMLAKTVSSGSDEYDLISNHMSQATSSLIAGYYADMAEYAYLDQDMPWWNSSYAYEITVDGHQYLAIGELSLSYISGMYAMFFNKTLWEETRKADELYDLVRAQKWTFDKLAEFTNDFNRDLNGDGRLDGNDVCGLYYQKPMLASDALAFAANIKFITHTGDGEYEFVLNNERTIEFVEKMRRILFENNGVIMENTGARIIMEKLSQNTALFTVGMLGDTTYLRSMEDDYGIIPLPKLNEAQASYTSQAHDGSSAFGMPNTVRNGDTVAAFLEAMSAESYRRVTHAYYDNALKVQYARDPVFAEMMDLISASVTFDFAVVYNPTLGSPASCFRDMFTDPTKIGAASSTFKSMETSTQNSIRNLVRTIQRNTERQ